MRDSLCDSIGLVAGHAQTHTSDLPHDELALLSGHCGAIGSSPMARAARKQRGPLLIWFDPETIWLAEPSGKPGRPAMGAGAAIQACLTLQAVFGLPLRQTTGLVASLLELAGLDWAVPDFGTLSRRPSGLNGAIPHRPSTGALHLLTDSTGIRAAGEGACFAKKHDPSKPRQWRKVHLGSDADTLGMRAIAITGSRVGDVGPASATGSSEPARDAARPAEPDRR